MSTALTAARAKTKGKRVLRNALDSYGDEDTSVSKWNARKKIAVEEGKWVWKEGVANANALKIPGVFETSARKELKREAMLKLPDAKSSLDGEAGRKLGLTSVCTWQKEHSEVNYVWRCSNRVLMHPVLRGSYLPFCGFHAPRCIQEYGNKGKKEQACPLTDRKNRYGMCRNHLEAHLSTLSFEERGGVLLIDSDFDVPASKSAVWCSYS